MQRTRNDTKSQQKASAILTGDWHLREDTPVAFTGDFLAEQWRVVDYIADLQRKHQCPVLNSGDLFNNWKPSPYLLSQAIKHLPDQFGTIYGNHDLPQHNLDLAYKCGINVLKEAGVVSIINGCHWGQLPPKDDEGIIKRFGMLTNTKNVLVWHVMTYKGKRPWPGCVDPMAIDLLHQYPQYDLILTGHNHKPFFERYEGRLLVNPGGITRQSADQIDQAPGVFLWYAETNEVVWHPLPFTEEAISRDHIDKIEQRDARIDAFISKLDGEWIAGMSFEDNLDEFCKINNIEQPVKEIIYKALEA